MTTRVKCPKCGEVKKVTKEGRLPKHYVPASVLLRGNSRVCSGSGLREYMVINSSMMNVVFSTPEDQVPLGYFPRVIAEEILGRSMEGVQWFTVEEGKKMRDHPQWKDKL